MLDMIVSVAILVLNNTRTTRHDLSTDNYPGYRADRLLLLFPRQGQRTERDALVMRELTLNEKITIKGILHARGVPISYLRKANMSAVMFYWSMFFRGSIKFYYKYN